jgi:hypothetical protein
LERELKRKDKALAETAALLVLSKMYGPPRVCKGQSGEASWVLHKCIRPIYRALPVAMMEIRTQLA